MFIPAVHAPLLHRTHQAPRSRELAGHLRAAIAAYRRDHPKLTTDEIAAALQSVRELEIAAAAGAHPAHPARPTHAQLPASPAPAPAAVRIVSIVVLGMAIFGAFIWLLNSVKHGNPFVWPALALALLTSITAIIAFTLWRDR